MKKKSLLIAMAAMSVAAIGAGTVSTMAWYTAASVTAQAGTAAALGTMSVQGASESLGSVYINITKKGTPATSLIITNRTGHSYQRSGDNYVEVAKDDDGSTLGSGKKQASMQWQVTITTASGGSTGASADTLASLTNKTYYIKATASGQAKMGLEQTTSLTADHNTPVYNFNLKNNPNDNEETPVTAATGALGADKEAVVEIMRIVIENNGVAKYSVDNGTTWTNNWDVASAADTKTVYYGLECEADAGEASPDETGDLTPGFQTTAL